MSAYDLAKELVRTQDALERSNDRLVHLGYSAEELEDDIPDQYQTERTEQILKEHGLVRTNTIALGAPLAELAARLGAGKSLGERVRAARWRRRKGEKPVIQERAENNQQNGEQNATVTEVRRDGAGDQTDLRSGSESSDQS